MALYIPRSIFHLARFFYVRPETFGTYYVTTRGHNAMFCLARLEWSSAAPRYDSLKCPPDHLPNKYKWLPCHHGKTRINGIMAGFIFSYKMLTGESELIACNICIELQNADWRKCTDRLQHLYLVKKCWLEKVYWSLATFVFSYKMLTGESVLIACNIWITGYRISVCLRKLAELEWQCRVLLLLLLLLLLLFLNKSLLLCKRLLHYKLHLRGFLCFTYKRQHSRA
jgi:hypothetical protein